MLIDVVVPVTRRQTVDRLLYSFSRGSTAPDVVTLVNNDLAAADLKSYGLNVRVLSMRSEVYPIGMMDAALRRNAGIWASPASHIIMFDDDQLAPPDLIENARALLVRDGHFWGHHRFLSFSERSIDDILRQPAEAGRPREFPPNAWHSWRSAYAGLFGAERSLLMEIGGFDMLFSGRHGGEDQNLGRRLAARLGHGESVFVHEPPFAWHPEENVAWDAGGYSNLCMGAHDFTVDARDGSRRCLRCPFYWAPEDVLLRDDVGRRFDFDQVTVACENLTDRGPISQITQLTNGISVSQLNEAVNLLREAYIDYTSNVSPSNMATSLQAAALLSRLCEMLKPTRILDLGTGFSSFVFANYARTHRETVVWSVDDDSTWLGKTADFLEAKGLPRQNLVLWSELSSVVTPESVDLVFHDLGSMAVRLATLPAVLRYAAPHAVVVLDDLHKEEYLPGANRVLREGGWHYRTQRPATLDEFGRFCGLAVRENHRGNANDA